MTSRKRNGFAKLWRGVWDSDAMRSLPPGARDLFWDMVSRQRPPCCRVRYGILDAMARGFSRRSAIRYLGHLRQSGLVHEIAKGSFDHKEGARAGVRTLWDLTCLKGK